MIPPVAVLVVPAAGDRGGLLTPGPCGAMLPWAQQVRVSGPSYTGLVWAAGSRWPPEDPRHVGVLPLWWDDALVPEGWDRARRVLANRMRSFLPSDWSGGAGALLDASPGTESILDTALMGRLLFELGLASGVVLLDRVDGRLVERVP